MKLSSYAMRSMLSYICNHEADITDNVNDFGDLLAAYNELKELDEGNAGVVSIYTGEAMMSVDRHHYDDLILKFQTGEVVLKLNTSGRLIAVSTKYKD